jgi:hypothetical protein
MFWRRCIGALHRFNSNLPHAACMCRSASRCSCISNISQPMYSYRSTCFVLRSVCNTPLYALCTPKRWLCHIPAAVFGSTQPHRPPEQQPSYCCSAAACVSLSPHDMTRPLSAQVAGIAKNTTPQCQMSRADPEANPHAAPLHQQHSTDNRHPPQPLCSPTRKSPTAPRLQETFKTRQYIYCGSKRKHHMCVSPLTHSASLYSYGHMGLYPTACLQGAPPAEAPAAPATQKQQAQQGRPVDATTDTRSVTSCINSPTTQLFQKAVTASVTRGLHG